MCDRVLQRQHELAGRTLTLVAVNDVSEEMVIEIEVSGFSSAVHEDILKMYFESTKMSGGGKIQNFQMDRAANTAIMTFADQSGLYLLRWHHYEM